MRGKRSALLAGVAAAALALAVEPVAAQSTTANLINELNAKLLYVAIPITLVTEVVLFYTVYKYRKSDAPKPTKENRRLEITWTVATAIILLFVGVASYGVLADPAVTYTPDMGDPMDDEDAVVVDVEAYQWGWTFGYPQAEGNVTTSTEIAVPKDRVVYFRITSSDVLHAFAVPELGLKQDAIPGQTNTIRTTPLENGQYQGYCTEYCGVAHSQMYFNVTVMDQGDYETWLQEQQSSGSSGGNQSSGNASAGNASAGNASAGNASALLAAQSA
ncbi:cytochrome c oxidase subunit II [Halobium salinum]|uniref:cytochrome-c oxidase n=1 Tax=Halobium salinum TaxID=1364940 RepID=A0ABD5P7Y0_9EURY|nr:cytochrome c oxidase subunit II [Halobium salinum]